MSIMHTRPVSSKEALVLALAIVLTVVLAALILLIEYLKSL